MVDPSSRDGLAQRLGDVLLTDDIGEPSRAVLPVQSQRHAARLPTAGGPVGRTLQGVHGDRGTPRTRQSPLTLLPSGPGGVHRMDAARGPRCSVVR